MAKIVSSVDAANAAVAEIQSVTINKWEEVSVSQSNIASMKIGMELNNQLLSDLNKLVEYTKSQSQKFCEIANMIELRDSMIKF